MAWTAIIPMSPLDRAKTRLADASSNPARHRALVRAMRRDTVRAVLGVADIRRLLIVSSTPDAALADLADLFGASENIGAAAVPSGADRRVHLLADPVHDGLNPALAHAAAHARTVWPQDGLVLVMADLPALTAAALTRVLDQAATVELGLVADRQGMGTTMLTAAPGQRVHPRFGPGSARRHADLGAVRLNAPAVARTDVDVVDDLAAARRLGFGPDMDDLLRSGGLPLPPPDRRD